MRRGVVVLAILGGCASGASRDSHPGVAWMQANWIGRDTYIEEKFRPQLREAETKKIYRCSVIGSALNRNGKVAWLHSRSGKFWSFEFPDKRASDFPMKADQVCVGTWEDVEPDDAGPVVLTGVTAELIASADGSQQTAKGKLRYRCSTPVRPTAALWIQAIRGNWKHRVTTQSFKPGRDLSGEGELEFSVDLEETSGSGPAILFFRIQRMGIPGDVGCLMSDIGPWCAPFYPTSPRGHGHFGRHSLYVCPWNRHNQGIAKVLSMAGPIGRMKRDMR